MSALTGADRQVIVEENSTDSNCTNMYSSESSATQHCSDDAAVAIMQRPSISNGLDTSNEHVDDDGTDFSTLIDSESERDDSTKNDEHQETSESLKISSLEKNMLVYELPMVKNQYHQFHRGRNEKKDLDMGVMKDEYSKATINTAMARKCRGRNSLDLELGELKDEYTYADAMSSTFESDVESSLLPIDDSQMPLPLHLSSIDDCNELFSAELVNPENDRRELVEQVLQAIHHQAVSATEVIVATETHGNKNDNERTNDKVRCRLYFLILFLLILVGVLAIFVGVVFKTLAQYTSSPALVAQPPSGASTPSSPTPTVVAYRSPTAISGSNTNKSRAAFQTLGELYLAVDTYMEVARTSINPENSEVAMRYGYPIGTWNVTLIRDFTRVFDPLRRKEFYETTEIVKDITTGNVLQPAFTSLAFFNEDLSGWDVSNATSMFGMFARAESFEGIGLERWNVSNVRDVAYMFYGAISFNGSISDWDTSKCTNMTSMFYLATNFNGDLSNWDTSRVKTMEHMFTNAFKFEGGQVLSNWNVHHVKNMASMFEGAESFDGNISLWDTAKVSDMSYMFKLATSFNGDLSLWPTGSVQNIAGMFNNAYAFDGRDLTHWDTSSVTNMYEVFHGATNFTGNIETWNVSQVETFVQMFHGATNFNGNLSMWDTSNAVQMDAMFSFAYKFEGNGLSNWSTGNVKSMHAQFFSAYAFIENISKWDTSKVEDTSEMFSDAISFNVDISNWNVSSVIQMYQMFTDARDFNQNLCSWYVMLNGSRYVNDMFEGTGCPIQADPIIDGGMTVVATNATISNGTQYSFCTPC